MNLNFTDEEFKNYALATKSVDYENGRSAADALLFVINGLGYDELDNLCNELVKEISGYDLSLEDAYMLTQGKSVDGIIFNDDIKETILNAAISTLEKYGNMGNKIVNGFNTTAFISHSLYEGLCASNLARIKGLDPDTAMKLGILHDVGRRETHTFNHTILGFERLIKGGFTSEAFVSLTHSFLSHDKDGVKMGGRSANCDLPLDGFYVNSLGNEVIPKDNYDDMAYFLDSYEYNDYDFILNIADLMATGKGIESPYDRVTDIRTRKPGGINNAYFLCSFMSCMSDILGIEFDKNNVFLDINTLTNMFKEMSDTFISYFRTYESTQKKL